MDARIERLEERLDALNREMAELGRRLEHIEGRLPARPDVRATLDGVETVAADVERPIGPAMNLAGRTLMVFGGAYLLRAITETAIVPALAGVALGLGYALVWLIAAERSVRSGRRLSGVVHGVASPIIGFPLVWETTARFGLLPPSTASVVLVILVATGLAVALRLRLHEVAWAHLLLGLGTAVALVRATHQPLVATVTLLVMAAQVEGLTFRGRWPGLRWPVAIVLDLVLLLTVAITAWRGGPPPGYPHLDPVAVVVTGLALSVLYLGSVTARTLARGEPARAFDVVQTAIALLLGFGCATYLTSAYAAVGAVALVLGAACYGAAFTLLERRESTARNFYVWTTFALLLMLTGARLAIPGTVLPYALGGTGLLAAWLAARHGRTTLATHGLCYLLCAAMPGLITASAGSLWTVGGAARQTFGPSDAFLALASAVAYGLLAHVAHKPAVPEAMRFPRAGIAALVVFAGAGICASTLAALTSVSADAAMLAAERTVVFAATAVVLAGLGRLRSLPELVWVLYPVLAAGGVGMLIEGLRHGRPLTLFVSFAAYGAALFATPLILKDE